MTKAEEFGEYLSALSKRMAAGTVTQAEVDAEIMLFRDINGVLPIPVKKDKCTYD